MPSVQKRWLLDLGELVNRIATQPKPEGSGKSLKYLLGELLADLFIWFANGS